MDKCRYCNLPVENSVKTLAYWNQAPDVCHSLCKAAGERQEAIDCQTIDADCNDCKWFERGQRASKVVSVIKTPDGRTEETSHQPNLFHGWCKS